MAYTQTDYNHLCSAIAQGALKVKYQDKEVTYRSLSEMRSIKQEMELELFPSQATSGVYHPNYDKGI